MPRSLRNALASVDAERNAVRQLWDLLCRVPGGTWLFSRVIGRLAPYTGSIGAHVLTLQPGHAVVRMRDRPPLRNHLRSVHAIALANLAELTGNLALSYGLPDDARFIPVGMTVDWVKKARGPITGSARCEVPASSARRELEVPVALTDGAGDVVMRATLRTLVGPKVRPA